MKNLLFTLAFCGLSLFNYAQSSIVEKSIFNIQTGFLGIYFNNESRLANSIALRSEIGLDTGIWGNDINNIDSFLLTPVITLEPRWYYNLNKRVQKKKKTTKNTGNFVSIKTSYHPDWFTISSENNINFTPDISIIPTWGIRRHIGSHFNFETGIGIGYLHYFFKEQYFYFEDEDQVALNLHLRIGYSF
ncbi:hypothetical protein [Formosa sp. S-31]|uniref:hypothetical protein n=1 Tax=Formosa sp. S-31 TaxID=2790949 RepID=UPI003EBE0817